MPRLAETPFLKRFGSESVAQMNMIHNKIHWPVLVYFIFRQRIDVEFKGLTMLDFKNALFNPTNTPVYLRNLAANKTPILTKQESMYERTVWNLTPYGKWLADLYWKNLVYITKKEGDSIEEYIQKLIATRNLEPDPGSKDVEEEQISKVQAEKERRAGIIRTESGSIIDLNKVEVTD